MRLTQGLARPRDEIDVIVDELLADPSRAAEVKTVLRRRFAERRTRPGRDREVQRGSEAEEFWDNVPL